MNEQNTRDAKAAANEMRWLNQPWAVDVFPDEQPEPNPDHICLSDRQGLYDLGCFDLASRSTPTAEWS